MTFSDRILSRRVAIALISLAIGFSISTSPEYAAGGQQGGSILYEDRPAATQDLEFKAWVWRVRGHYKSAAVYRPVGSGRWKELDKNWCWYRRCALREMVVQARYIARDGYIWRFQDPAPAPDRATSYRFTESSYRDGTAICARRLLWAG